MTRLSDAILAVLRNPAITPVRARHLASLSPAADRLVRERHVDRTLQNMRRKGTISYTSKGGWTLADERTDEERAPAPLPTHPRDLDQQLAALKAMPGYQNIVDCLRVDRESWAADERDVEVASHAGMQHDVEDRPGEARERREAYDAILALLGEAVAR